MVATKAVTRRTPKITGTQKEALGFPEEVAALIVCFILHSLKASMALSYLFHRPCDPYYCNAEGRRMLHYVASLNPARILGHHKSLTDNIRDSGCLLISPSPRSSPIEGKESYPSVSQFRTFFITSVWVSPVTTGAFRLQGAV